MDFDPFEIFNAFFGGSAKTGRSRTGRYTYSTSDNPFGGFGFGFGSDGTGFNPFQQEVKGQDINITLRVSLDDVMNGVNKQVKIKHSVSDETGTVRQIEEVIPIQLPKGVMEGQKFRAKGKGNAAPGGQGSPGDLIVNIEEIPHPELLRDHEDLVYNCLISFPIAALGGPVEIPTLNGRVRINVPAGTQPGKMLRLKGKGLPSKDTGLIGDLIVNILVYVPEKLNSDERKAIEKLTNSKNCTPTEDNRQSLFSRIKYFFTKQE
jgi:molecular chaperone DnaJ